MASGFFDRLVSRVDKLDSGSLQAQILRLANERGFLETIFQTIQEGLLVLDSSGCLVFANQAAEQIVGFRFAEQQGHSMFRLLREWDWEHLLNGNQDASGWASLVTREIEVMYPEHRFVSVYAAPLSRDTSSEENVLVILRDVTAERLRENSALETERTNAVCQLAAGVAHEIGNPLNALNIHLQVLARDLREETALDKDTRNHYDGLVQVARSEVSRLDAIIRQFLGALRPSRLVLRPEQPEEVVKDSLKVLQTELENRRIAVSLDAPARIPKLMLDREQMQQVFFNLVKNAMEAMPDGGRLRILFEVGDAFVTISIVDSGKGIPVEELGRLFEPYHTTKVNGNGLGLMIVKRIVSGHGGEIEVSSKPETGTCFKIRLPLQERRIRRLNA